ncbi:hypothetical protein V7112_08555 [Bacillus sp. JJ1566]|uniref:DUF7210 family protein n=1 Tax=Bacillus sp. JJ1566 TaxID=3122961 RepID=UPI00300077E2
MDLIALGSVKHNGKWFNEGDSIKKIKKEDGERLIDMGVAKVDEEAAKKLAEELAKKEAEEKEKAEAKAKKKAEEDAKKETEKK